MFNINERVMLTSHRFISRKPNTGKIIGKSPDKSYCGRFDMYWVEFDDGVQFVVEEYRLIKDDFTPE
jgi:hypothetical protein